MNVLELFESGKTIFLWWCVVVTCNWTREIKAIMYFDDLSLLN